ncbi:MAG: hypothetical protein U1E55_05395 [Paracoccus sp. (in: a-proteobacteria)]
MGRGTREFHTLDKDLQRVTNTERAIMHSARPVFRLGIALIFVAAATLAATEFFAGQPSASIIAAGGGQRPIWHCRSGPMTSRTRSVRRWGRGRSA